MEIPDILLSSKDVEDVKVLTAFLETLDDAELKFLEEFDPRWNMKTVYAAALRRRRFPQTPLAELLESCKKCFLFNEGELPTLVEFHLPYMERDLFACKFPNWRFSGDGKLTEEELNYLVERLKLETYDVFGSTQYLYDERFLPTEKLIRFQVEQTEQVSSYYEVVAATEREAVAAICSATNKTKKRMRKWKTSAVCSTTAKPVDEQQITFS